MQNRRRGLLGRLVNLLQRAINAGGAANQPSPPVSREEEIPSEQEQSFQPLPETAGSGPSQQEMFITEESITPGIVQGNVEYIPGHYTTNKSGGQSRVYGRYRVTAPETGDMQDLLNQSGDTIVTVVVVGMMDRYAGIPIGKEAASYRIDVNRMNYIMEHTPANTMEDALNEYLSQSGDEWVRIDEVNIINKADRPE